MKRSVGWAFGLGLAMSFVAAQASADPPEAVEAEAAAPEALPPEDEVVVEGLSATDALVRAALDEAASLAWPAAELTVDGTPVAADGFFVVPVGAYAEPEGVIAKLKAAKIPYYTEPVATEKGTVTRVRAGPYATRDAAERAQRRIRALGFTPGSVAARS